MSIKCLMNGLEVNYPCSPMCALFGDCVTAFEAQKKENVRTNADRIRAMSDEELAKALYRMQKEVCTHIAIAAGFSPEELDFADEAPDILDWLQQPVEVER